MHSILLKDQVNAYEALRMQKDRLKMELHNATYQAFADKSVIETGLSDLDEMKALIQGQLQVLSDSLSIRMTKLNRFNFEKERSLEELKHMQAQKVRQESVMESIIASSIREHNGNALLSSSLGDLQIGNKVLSEEKRKLRDTLDVVKRKIVNVMENVKIGQVKNSQSILRLKSMELKNKDNKSRIVNLTFEIEQSILTVQKINGDTSKFKNYGDKLKMVNSDIESECVRVKSEVERLENEGHLAEKEIGGVETNYQDRVADNRRRIKDNQVVTAQNHNLYQSNNVMILEESNSKQILAFLSEMNVKLKAVLSQKQIVNKHTQSVLGLPLAKSQSKLTNVSRMDKSLGSTGTSFY